MTTMRSHTANERLEAEAGRLARAFRGERTSTQWQPRLGGSIAQG